MLLLLKHVSRESIPQQVTLLVFKDFFVPFVKCNLNKLHLFQHVVDTLVIIKGSATRINFSSSKLLKKKTPMRHEKCIPGRQIIKNSVACKFSLSSSRLS